MSRKAEQKENSRARILASAAALLRERGIRASSVADVMGGAGLTVGGFYGHFDSKERLLSETIRSAAKGTWDRLLGGAKGDAPNERVQSVVDRYLSRSHRDRAKSGCILPSTVSEIAREGEPYRGALAAELERFVQSLADIVGEEPGARQRALGLIALMYGALSLSRAVAETPLSDELLRAGRALANEKSQ